jgi:hypothetical protein
VLLYAAEDSLAVVRQRLEGIAQACKVSFDALDVHVITATSLRLDRAEDRERLAHTVSALHPRLLVLDPFIRLHRIDENAAGEVAPLLAYLRELQRRHRMAVVLVHHARKGAAHVRAGQALRGSSELHAWGDSNLYLQRKGNLLRLSVEHRAAPSMENLLLELRQRASALALEMIEGAPPQSPDSAKPTPAQRIESALRASQGPLSLQELRMACRMRTTNLCAELTALQGQGHVIKRKGRYDWTKADKGVSLSASCLQSEGNGNGNGRLGSSDRTHPKKIPGETEASSAGTHLAEG